MATGTDFLSPQSATDEENWSDDDHDGVAPTPAASSSKSDDPAVAGSETRDNENKTHYDSVVDLHHSAMPAERGGQDAPMRGLVDIALSAALQVMKPPSRMSSALSKDYLVCKRQWNAACLE
ncbi:hypothetical protein AJ80_10093 [Polytolypa hystricis UAMH7299]|uniref:Uncharacterized protein n=1 Tax=Polytolypa hystricis (strain UAMH7299) TaxID=1447883 RepID=A0A2B7WE93_POLH7|nr:hypothetical protein AJ80_10093 [Polytolypa hystricis UAMH7299]